MSRLFQILFVLFLSSTFGIANAQVITLSGYIKSKKNSASIAYVSLSITNSNISTISNSEGKFTINLPQSLRNEYLSLSCIGFESQKIKVSELSTQKNLVITLNESNTALQEVVINNESAEQIVAHAHRNIPLNYPQNNTFYTGFYRESKYRLFDNHTEKYSYVIEAILGMNSYSAEQHKTDDIKIEQSQQSNFLSQDSSVKWFAGAYTPIRFDIIRQDFDFIKPGGSRKYSYQHRGYTSYYDRPVYIISFEPKGNADYKGTLYISVRDYAIVKADYQLTDNGMKYDNIFRPVVLTARIFKTNYQPLNGKWYLQSVWQQATGKEKRLNDSFRYVTEYATTKIDTNYQRAFDYIDKLQFGEVLSTKVLPYNPDFWKSYNIVAQTSDLQELLLDTAKTLNSRDFKELKTLPVQSPDKRAKLLRFKPLYVLPSFSTIHTSGNSTNLVYKNQDNITIVNQDITPKSSYRLIGFGFGIGYAVYKDFFANYLSVAEYGPLNRTVNDFGVSYQKTISASNKRPIRFVVGLDYSFNSISRHIDTFHPLLSTDIGGKSFTNDINIVLQSNMQGIKPKLGFNIEINKLLNLYADGGYFLQSNQNDILKFKENPSDFLSRIFPKQQGVNISTDGVSMLSKGQTLSHISFKRQMAFQMGLRGYVRFRH